VVTTLLPVILSKMGGRLDWPHLRTDDRASRSWTGWGALLSRHRVVAAAVATVVLGGLVGAATTINLGSADGSPDTISQAGDAPRGPADLARSGIGSGGATPV